MVVIKNENVDFFDVDGSLVIHCGDESNIPLTERIRVVDPVTNMYVVVRINKPMVRLLKESFTRGSNVIVWSRGGYQWAVNVIKALGLQPYVHTVMSKPLAIFDDTPVEKWLAHRVFVGPDENYKQVVETAQKENK